MVFAKNRHLYRENGLFLVLKIAEKDENVKTGNCLKANFDIRDRF